MLQGVDGHAVVKEKGDGYQKELKHDEKNMAAKPAWTALPDLILTLLPTGILLISGNADERVYVLSLLGIVGGFSWFEEFRPPKTNALSILGSLVYSSVFPFTVTVGGASGSAMGSSYVEFGFVIACMTVCISTFNPSFQDLLQWTILPAAVDDRWYLSTLLYISVFGAISNTAEKSFNFEEVSLISQAVTHTLLYVTETPEGGLLAHEIFLPALTFGMLAAIIPAVPVLQNIRKSSKSLELAISSYAIVVTSIFLAVRPWIVSKLGDDPVIWVLNYMMSSEGYEMRLEIVLYWLVVLAFGIFVPVRFFTGSSDSHDDGESLNKRRKFFHGIVVLLFLPALNLDSQFTSIAMSLATSLFLLAEVIRHYEVPPLGSHLGGFFSIFTDERDTRGPLVVSHIFLLVGCAVPVWMSLYGSKKPTITLPIEGFSGVLCLGCGDAMASIIGKKYGRRRWPRTKKTIEGTIAFAMAVMIGAFVTAEILPRLPFFAQNLGNIRWDGFIVSTILTALLEAMSLQNDNLVVPVYMWILLRLWNVNGK